MIFYDVIHVYLLFINFMVVFPRNLLTHSEQIFRVYFSFIIEKISKDTTNS